MHEDLIRSARRRLRLVTAGGGLLLTLTVAAIVFPIALVVFGAFAALGARWDTGWSLLRWSLGVSFVFGLIGAAVVLTWSLVRSERRVLEFVRAWPLPDRDAPRPPRLPEHAWHQANNLVQGLALAAGVLPPRCAVIVDDAPNCLTVGRDPKTAWIVVTTGLLHTLPRAELEAVLAYEIGRVAELDVSLDTVVYACTARVFELWAGVFDDIDEMTFIVGPMAVLAAPLVIGGVLLRAVALRTRARPVGRAGGAVLPQSGRAGARAAPHRRGSAGRRRGDPGNAHLWLEYPHTRPSRWFLRTHRTLPERVRRIEEIARLPQSSAESTSSSGA